MMRLSLKFLSQAAPSTLSDDEWIRVDESEAKALERGDDSVMDKYYEQQDGQEAAGEAVPQTGSSQTRV